MAYTLRHFAHWDYKRIAEQLDVPLATVGRASQRAVSPPPLRRERTRLLRTLEKRRLRDFLRAFSRELPAALP
jgi:DNA-directed RNA polymerase specialized sigma24 family protein